MRITEFINEAVQKWEVLDLTPEEWETALSLDQFRLYLQFRTLVELQKLTASTEATIEAEPVKVPRTRKKAQ